jgi:outer membrane protein
MTFFSLLGLVYSESNILDHHVDVAATKLKGENLRIEDTIRKNLLLPNLSLNGGFGSEKFMDSSEKNEGPYLYLEGQLNLYRGGKDLHQKQKTQTLIDIADLEHEIKIRDSSIEIFKIMTQIHLIASEIELMTKELDNNKSQMSMAKKKVNAGLTSSIDLIDFELKEQYLINERDHHLLEKESLEKEVLGLFGEHKTYQELEKNYKENLSHLQPIHTSVNHDPLGLKLVNKELDLLLIDKRNRISHFFPSIDLTAKWGQITPKSKLFSRREEQQVLLNINIPLSSGLITKEQLKQSEGDIDQKNREVEKRGLALLAKKELDMKKIELSKKLLTLLENSLQKVQKYKELTISDYKRGIKNSSDLLSASDKMLETERKILQARSEFFINMYSFNENFRKD